MAFSGRKGMSGWYSTPPSLRWIFSVFRYDFILLIAKRCALRRHLECGSGTSKQREVAQMGMTHREIEADGNAIVLHILMEHLIHILETILWVLVFVELSYDDAS